eukprot:364880-Chlamydomonas_euryale.AAC.3
MACPTAPPQRPGGHAAASKSNPSRLPHPPLAPLVAGAAHPSTCHADLEVMSQRQGAKPLLTSLRPPAAPA